MERQRSVARPRSFFDGIVGCKLGPRNYTTPPSIFPTNSRFQFCGVVGSLQGIERKNKVNMIELASPDSRKTIEASNNPQKLHCHH
jgi:hypothetical protein